MVFSNFRDENGFITDHEVTILILIDGFLQYQDHYETEVKPGRHNPYFNRWFSAILIKISNYANRRGHNPYFNRWFSAMGLVLHLRR